MELRQGSSARCGARTCVMLIIGLSLVSGCDDPPAAASRKAHHDGVTLQADSDGILVSDGGAMALPVAQCHSVDAHGRIGINVRPVLYDITSRGWGCHAAVRYARTAQRMWRGQRGTFRSGRLTCYRLYSSAKLNTIRCWSRSFRAVRFTVNDTRALKQSHTARPAVLCGAFRTYFDIAVRGMGCAAASDLIRSSSRAWLRPRVGRVIRAHAGFVCSLIYVEGDQPTYRCLDSRHRTLRFTRGNEPVIAVLAFGRPAFRERHDMRAQLTSRYPHRSNRANAWIADPARSDVPVAPEVITPCASTGSFQDVMALGIACDQLDRLIPQASHAAQSGVLIEGLRCMRKNHHVECASSSGYQGFRVRLSTPG